MRRVAAVLVAVCVVALLALQTLGAAPSVAETLPTLTATPPLTPVGYLPVIAGLRPTRLPAPTAPPPPTPTEVPGLPQFVNADFEQGHIGWTEIPSHTLITQPNGYPAHSGQWVAWLGGEPGSADELYQAITLPTGSPLYIRFYYLVPDGNGDLGDYLTIWVDKTHSFSIPLEPTGVGSRRRWI
jgi:hypothetical protein